MKNSVLGLSDKLDFYFYQRPVPMNKGIETLRGLVINEFGRDPEDGAVYIFISKGMKEIKLLHHHNGIYTMYTHKIYKGRFVYPVYNRERDLYVMDWLRLKRLLNGCAKYSVK